MTTTRHKNPIRILTVLSLLTYAYFIFTLVASNLEDFRMGYEAGANSVQDTTNTMSNRVYYLSLKPKHDIFYFPNTIMNAGTQEIVSYRPNEIKALGSQHTTMTSAMKWEEGIGTFIAFGMIFILIYLPFGIRRLLKNFKTETIFHKDNVRSLRRIGGLLVLAFIMLFIEETMYHNTLSSLYSFDNYEIAKDPPSFAWLLCGLLFMIFGEALNNGIALKEENDLTV